MSTTISINRQTYLPKDFSIIGFESVETYLTELVNRDLPTIESLENWLSDWSELDATIGEDYRWRYIAVTINTADNEASKRLNDYYSDIEPAYNKVSFELSKKLIQHPLTVELPAKKYFAFIRAIRNFIELFRDENLDLLKQLQIKEKEYSALSGRMTITHQEQEVTLTQAAVFLRCSDRALREDIYRKISARRLKDKAALDQLFDELLTLRHKIALNAGFENYREYRFKQLNRFDYGVNECEQFHHSIETIIKPLLDRRLEFRKHKLGLDSLKPWDTAVDLEGTDAAKPFEHTDELIAKTGRLLSKVDNEFGHFFSRMIELRRLDLDNRLNKAPGGYNMSMPLSKAPFIFMNAVGSEKDVRTIVHEAGHAMHSFLMSDQPLVWFQEITPEVAELASMSMELFSMDYWDEFYLDPSDRNRAVRNQLDHILEILTWIASVDAFQLWVYSNPGHSVQERESKWLELMDRFHSSIVEWEGVEEEKKSLWHRQIHIFEYPFYYIEYGLAQLGALAMWHQYKVSPQTAISNYKKALSLGSSVTIPEMYRAAGIEFRFDSDYIRQLSNELMNSLNATEN